MLRATIALLSVTSFAVSANIALPTGEDWINHASEGLAPYWLIPSAQGEPIGNFPTFRCDDGTLLDVTNVCPELNRGWITPHFGKEFTRMKSRQTYAYGVLYHLTGDKQALALAKQGAYYLVEHLEDEQNGGFISFTKDGKAGLEWQQRTSQDQAYALVGLAMYNYLTQDKKVEQALIAQQAFIFDKYRLNDNSGLAWVLADGEDGSAKQRELVAQLDQINGYMLLIAPLLSEPTKSKWLDDLDWLTQAMIDRYHSQDEQRFYGAIHSKAAMMPNANHNDLGHTIKAYWMTYLTGQTLDNSEWKEFGMKGMKHTLAQAQYQKDFTDVSQYFGGKLQKAWQGREITGWQSRPNTNWASSWEWAELDQAAMTVSLVDGSMKEVLQYTLPTFHDVWVDHKYGGVGLEPKRTKAFHWGNGYHQFEHALIGYLYAQQVEGQPAVLHYARPTNSTMPMAPYYYQGDLVKLEKLEGGMQKVSFNNIRP
ncbi:N-acylglucosamine 2-epimerase [Vibrio gigantis]|uniref:N-acylglucosamine 2-epimerase n=1 Tax=Vibrio gigantis TaxID=296199 RepID=UPI0035A5B343